MTQCSSVSVVVASALALAVGAAYAAQPPDVVHSDVNLNTAMGSFALYNMGVASWNTAAGMYALYATSTGGGNTGFGGEALYSNTTGTDNTAVGAQALLYNTTGWWNTAIGASALQSSTTGNGNTALGAQALYYNTTGADNIAVGPAALFNATTGSFNVAIGDAAGYSVTTGSYNVDIANPAVSGDTYTTRIGQYQTKVFIAGIASTQLTGAPVYVTSSGQLGVLASAERYKTAIEPMGAGSERLAKLRPVTFHLKSEPDGALQYGLVAEEVEHVYPELVIRDGAGTIQGVRYDELAPMLLNEVQKQQVTIASQAATIAGQAAQLRDLTEQLADLRVRETKIQVALERLAAAERVASR